MQDRPLVSVIVPVYNTEKYLEKCLDSILRQTYDNLEIIVINDGSTDNSLSVAENYAAKDNRIILINQENNGIMSVRITGVEQAKGKYIGFVDSDDWIEPDMYERLLQYMLKYDCDLVTSDARIHLLDGTTMIGYDNYQKGIYTDLQRDIYPSMLYDYTVKWRAMRSYLVSKLFRKDILLGIIKKLDKDIFYDEDTVILCAYCLACNSVYISRDINYHYVLRSGSATQKVRKNEPQNMFKVYSSLETMFEASPYAPIFRKQLRQYMIVLIGRLLNGLCNINFGGLLDWDFSAYQKIFGKKVIIYGAGAYGRGLCKELVRLNCYDKLIAWVDKNYEASLRWGDEHPEEFIGKLMRKVEPIDVIRHKDYDYIAIANANEDIASEISKDLQEKLGVPAEKIVWGKVFRKDVASIISVAYM